VVDCAGVAVAFVLALVLASPVGAAKVPAGPRLTVVIDRKAAPSEELVALGPNGEAPTPLDKNGFGAGNSFEEHPNWNAAGSQMAFFGPGDETTDVILIDADGSNPHQLVTSEHPGGAESSVLNEPLYDPTTGDLIVAVVHQPKGESLFGSERPETSSKKPKNRSVRSSGRCPRTARSRDVSAAGCWVPSIDTWPIPVPSRPTANWSRRCWA
jgi:hypothetical protein